MDLNLEVERFRFDEHVRALVERKRPGGKGINVSVVLGLLGLDSVAVAPLGGASGEEFLQFAGNDLAKTVASQATERTNRSDRQTHCSSGSRARVGKALLERVSVAASTRTNIVITSQRDGRHFKVNQQGRPLAPSEFKAVLRRLRSLVRPGDWLVLAGSLPPGMPNDTYADLIREFKAKGCFTALDADGEAFRAGVRAGPDVVKPNRQELERFAGRPLRTRAALLTAAGEILGMGTRLCLITDGPRPAWLVARDSARQPAAGQFAAWKGIPRRAQGSPTGAGDAALAGLLAGLTGCGRSISSIPSTASTQSTSSLEKAFRLALACGAASASTPDTEYFDTGLLKAMLARVEIERVV